jgi:hypothetical protein
LPATSATNDVAKADAEDSCAALPAGFCVIDH